MSQSSRSHRAHRLSWLVSLGLLVWQVAIAATLLAFVMSFVRNSILIPLFPSPRPLVIQSLLTLGTYDSNTETGSIYGTTVYSYQIPDRTEMPDVLGDSVGTKRIEVDLTNQRLYAFSGHDRVYDFPISSGLYDWTPRGTFRIWIKLRYTKMEGGSKALGTYYYLPNVPFTMYFANADIPAWRGFGIHGAYWHNSFGQPMSHGCVNLRIPDAETLYYWATPVLGNSSSVRETPDNPGTEVIIYGKYNP